MGFSREEAHLASHRQAQPQDWCFQSSTAPSLTLKCSERRYKCHLSNPLSCSSPNNRITPAHLPWKNLPPTKPSSVQQWRRPGGGLSCSCWEVTKPCEAQDLFSSLKLCVSTLTAPWISQWAHPSQRNKHIVWSTVKLFSGKKPTPINPASSACPVAQKPK